MDAKNRIIRSNIQLQRLNSFWAYLSLYLKFREVKKGEMRSDTMGVNCENGEVGYVKEFVDKLDDDELIGVIAHEINHLVFLTALREGSRDRDGWNCATDIAINTLLRDNNFKLPDKALMPDENYELNTGLNIIKDINKLTAEEIYDKLPKIEMKDGFFVVSANGKNGKKGKGVGKTLGKALDEHIKAKGGKPLSSKEKKAIEKVWGDRLTEALNLSRIKGDIPKGMERLIGELRREKINWKALLSNYITQQIPYNYTYAKPSKKSISTGFYMPDVLKEKIEVSVVIDLSGSIGQEEYSDFISEIIGLAKAYQERLTIKFYSHDTECYDGGIVENGNFDKIRNLKLRGGGGTSHLSCFNTIKEKERDCKCVIFFTDGYSDLEGINFNEYPFDKLFVITKDGDETCLKDKNCQVIKLKKD